MAPRVLLATTAKWMSTARLAIVLRQMGCVVDAVCPPGHPLYATRRYGHKYNFSAVRPLASFERAIRDASADLIVSCDETALQHLRSLHSRASPGLRSLIEHSIGDMGAIETALARSALVELAVEEGIPTPRSARVRSLGELKEQVGRLGLPFVLKADASAGGQGVRVVHEAGEERILWKRLRGPVSLPRTATRLLMDREWRHIVNYFNRQTGVVMAQEFIEGREGNVGVSCWKGEVVACISLEVINTWCVRGPSSVLRVVENEAMIGAARTLVRRLNFTGFCGFDFIFGPDGTPLLLEMNARPTQVAHLALGAGRDLAAAFLAAATGEPIRERPTCTTKPLIALFPQEWQRDPASSMFDEAYHDVPWSEPGLVRAGVNERATRGGARAYDRILASLRAMNGTRSRMPEGGRDV